MSVKKKKRGPPSGSAIDALHIIESEDGAPPQALVQRVAQQYLLQLGILDAWFTVSEAGGVKHSFPSSVYEDAHCSHQEPTSGHNAAVRVMDPDDRWSSQEGCGQRA